MNDPLVNLWNQSPFGKLPDQKFKKFIDFTIKNLTQFSHVINTKQVGGCEHWCLLSQVAFLYANPCWTFWLVDIFTRNVYYILYYVSIIEHQRTFWLSKVFPRELSFTFFLKHRIQFYCPKVVKSIQIAWNGWIMANMKQG